MPPDGTNDLCAHPPSEAAELIPEAPEDTAPWRSWSRRTFLKAAALGTAAAALINKDLDLGGLHLGPSPAYANDLSDNPCTAQDVEIIGAGIVLNEPCADCTPGGKFDASVQFMVRNNTGTGRYCIFAPPGRREGCQRQRYRGRRSIGQLERRRRRRAA